MPWGMRSHKSHGHRVFTVRNKSTGHVTAKHTTRAKAERQMHLLRAVKHGWHPTHRGGRK